MKLYRLRIFVLVLISFILGCSEFMVVGILSDISESLRISVAQTGHLVTVFALVYAVVTPFVATFLGRHSRYFSLLILTGLFIAGNLLSFLSGNYAVLMGARILTAAVSGPMISLGLTFANSIAPSEQRAKIISLVFAGFSIASVFGVPIGAWISAAAGWRFSFLAIACLSAGTLVLIAAVLPRGDRESPVRLGDQLRILTDPRIRIGVLLPLFGAAGFYVFYTYLRPILTDLLHFSVGSVGAFLFAFGITSIISNLLSGVIAEKSGLKKLPLIFLSQIFLFLSLPLALRSKIAGTAVIMTLGITMYLLNSPVQLYYFQVAEKDYPDSVVLVASFNSIFFNFGISLGSFLGGLIVDSFGLPYVGAGGSALALVTIALLAALNRIDSRPRPQKDAVGR